MTSELLYDYSPDAPPLVLPEPDVLVCERVIDAGPVFSAFIRDLMFLRLGTGLNNSSHRKILFV